MKDYIPTAIRLKGCTCGAMDPFSCVCDITPAPPITEHYCQACGCYHPEAHDEA